MDSSIIRITWTSPLCPYGVISGYIVYYRQGDVARTGDIFSEGFTVVSVGSDVTEFLISGLPPYTNYTIHVQAVVMPSGSRVGLFGDIDVEIVQRTTVAPTTAAVPTVQPTLSPLDPPTAQTIPYLIADPRQINTGRVM